MRYYQVGVLCSGVMMMPVDPSHLSITSIHAHTCDWYDQSHHFNLYHIGGSRVYNEIGRELICYFNYLHCTSYYLGMDRPILLRLIYSLCQYYFILFILWLTADDLSNYLHMPPPPPPPPDRPRQYDILVPIDTIIDYSGNQRVKALASYISTWLWYQRVVSVIYNDMLQKLIIGIRRFNNWTSTASPWYQRVAGL